MTCDFAHDDGAYVLGALSPDDRQAFEGHLARCTTCAESVRRLAGLPGLLGRVPVDVLAAAGTTEDHTGSDLPESVLPRVVAEARRNGRRRRLALVALPAAAAVVGAAVTLGATGALSGRDRPTDAAGTAALSDPSSSAHPMQPIGQEAVTARVGLDAVAWGTRLALTCRYAGPGSKYAVPGSTTYALVVHTRDGRMERVATWRAVPGRTMQVTGASATRTADIRSVEVRTSTGRPVLRWSA
jgi:anti-sigma factor RsiW